ncbi:hypothetical protein D3C84_1211790 [compost metagenome]
MLQLDHAFADQGDARGVGAEGVDGVHCLGSLVFLCCLGGRLREQARSHIGMHSPVGASLLAMAAPRS